MVHSTTLETSDQGTPRRFFSGEDQVAFAGPNHDALTRDRRPANPREITEECGDVRVHI